MDGEPLRDRQPIGGQADSGQASGEGAGEGDACAGAVHARLRCLPHPPQQLGERSYEERGSSEMKERDEGAGEAHWAVLLGAGDRCPSCHTHAPRALDRSLGSGACLFKREGAQSPVRAQGWLCVNSSRAHPPALPTLPSGAPAPPSHTVYTTGL